MGISPGKGYSTNPNPWKFRFHLAQDTVDSLGRIIVGDDSNHRIQVFDINGNFLSTFGGAGSGNGQFSGIFSVGVDQSNNIYVADIGNFRIQVFDSAGNFLRSFGSEGNGDGQFGNGPPGSPYGPRGVAVDLSGNVFVSDTINNRIEVFDSNGTFLTQYQGAGVGQLAFPHGLAIDDIGHVAVADRSNNRIVVLNFVPEPASAGLLLVGSLLLVRSYRAGRRA